MAPSAGLGVTSGLGEPSPRDGHAQTHAVPTSKHQHKENQQKGLNNLPMDRLGGRRRGQGSGESGNGRAGREPRGSVTDGESSHTCAGRAQRGGERELKSHSENQVEDNLQIPETESTGHAYTTHARTHCKETCANESRHRSWEAAGGGGGHLSNRESTWRDRVPPRTGRP